MNKREKFAFMYEWKLLNLTTKHWTDGYKTSEETHEQHFNIKCSINSRAKKRRKKLETETRWELTWKRFFSGWNFKHQKLSVAAEGMSKGFFVCTFALDQWQDLRIVKLSNALQIFSSIAIRVQQLRSSTKKIVWSRENICSWMRNRFWIVSDSR